MGREERSRTLRLIVSLMVTVTVAAGPSAVTAHSPSPSPEAAGQPATTVRTFPDQGVAIVFPDDWDVTEFEALALPWALTAWGPDGYCEVFDWSLAEPALTVESLDDWLAALTSRWDHDLAAGNVTGAVVDLPAGRVGRVTMDVVAFSCSGGEPGGCRDWASQESADRYAMYLFGDAQRWIMLGCSAGAPEDDWLSIAETFEFLPKDERRANLASMRQGRAWLTGQALPVVVVRSDRSDAAPV